MLSLQINKLIHYRTFKLLVGLYILFFILVAYGAERAVMSTLAENGDIDKFLGMMGVNISIYSFPDVWHHLAWMGDMFQILLAVIVIIDVTNEYEFKTIRQNVIDGLSRQQFMYSKVVLVMLLAVVSTLLVGLTSFVLGYIHLGDAEGVNMFNGSIYLLAYFVQCLAYLSFAMFVAHLVKRAGFALGLMAIYTLGESIMMGLLNHYVNEDAGSWLPLEMIRNCIPISFQRYFSPDVQELIPAWSTLGLALMLAFAFCGLSWWLIKRRDI